MYGAMEPNLLHNIIVVDVFFFFTQIFTQSFGLELI